MEKDKIRPGVYILEMKKRAKYQKPKVEYVKGRDVEFVEYGEGNCYYDDLIGLFTTSPTNSRCIRGISDMIYGLGLEATDAMLKPAQIVSVRQIVKAKELKKVVKDFKQLGQGMAQVVFKNNRVVSIQHTPTECWRAERCKAGDGKVMSYLYHYDWSKYKKSDELKKVYTFGNTPNPEPNRLELYVFREYQPGNFYYTPVDYAGCIDYCELETEVSNYHINNIQNGLQPSLFINFNNGIPNEEQQQEVEYKINSKFSGTTNAGRAIIAFNDDAENAATIDAINIPDAHAQYQFLSDEAREKIMIGHGVTSPILLGIKDNTGFGNNAEELRTASILMDNMVIKPFQQTLIDGIKEILSVNGITLNFYFKTLQPIEFTDVDKIATQIRREEETGEKLSKESPIRKAYNAILARLSAEKMDFNDEEGHDLLSQLEGLGECLGEEWECVYAEDEQGNPEDVPTNLSIQAFPDLSSLQDEVDYKVRYAYSPVRQSQGSRNFCKTMEGYTRANVVFRKEDINMMSFRGVNRPHGHKGQNYSLFKYKGGVNCKHYWQKRVYMKKDGTLVNPNRVKTNNPKEVPVRPHDMPRQGHHPNYGK
jgi:hypothetical protein